jgi:hypothetical protein
LRSLPCPDRIRRPAGINAVSRIAARRPPCAVLTVCHTNERQTCRHDNFSVRSSAGERSETSIRIVSEACRSGKRWSDVNGRYMQRSFRCFRTHSTTCAEMGLAPGSSKGPLQTDVPLVRACHSARRPEPTQRFSNYTRQTFKRRDWAPNNSSCVPKVSALS